MPVVICDKPWANSENGRMQHGQHVIAVDGGGTKTVACLATITGSGAEGIIGRGASGPSNPHAVGMPQALNHLGQAVEAAFASAGLPLASVLAACLGMSGMGRAEERERLEAWNQEFRLARFFRIVHDAEPVLAAGTPDNWGIALIAGTGSLAFGRNPGGAEARTGGWGYLFGDEGSGYWLGVEALRAAARAADGRDASTRLLEQLLVHFEVDRPEQLVQAVYPQAGDRAAIAALAQIVLENAGEGDAVAQSIVKRAAGDLSDMVETLARRLKMETAQFPLALTGGLLLAADRLRQQLAEELQRRGLRLDARVVHEPVLGSLRLAREVALQASN